MGHFYILDEYQASAGNTRGYIPPFNCYKPVKQSLKEKAIEKIITFAFKPKTPHLKALQKV